VHLSAKHTEHPKHNKRTKPPHRTHFKPRLPVSTLVRNLVRNRTATSAFAFIHKAATRTVPDAEILFSFCSYHSVRSKCKRRLVFHGNTHSIHSTPRGGAAAYPSAYVEIFGARSQRLT